MKNIIFLIGMPGCGKSTVGKILAEKLNFNFVDLDENISTAAGMDIPEIFRREGEAGFRKREKTALFSMEKKQNTVVSCGGGIVLDGENVKMMHSFGVVYLIRRNLDELACGGIRPLSTSPEALREMFQKRRDLYENAADFAVENNSKYPPSVAAEKLMGKFYEN